MELYLQIISGMLVISIVLSVIRLIIGPGLSNRVVALDVIAILGASLTALFAIQFERRVFLDVTIVLALISFLGTVAFACYVEKKVQ